MAHIAFISYEIAPTTAGGVGVFVRSIVEALLRDGHRVSVILDIPAAQFEQWERTDSAELPNRACLRSMRVDQVCEDIGTDREAFPSEGHWRSRRFAHALAKLHAAVPVDFAEFFDYCGSAYYALVLRASEPDRYPARIAVRLHNTIEAIDRRTASEFAHERLYDYALERAALSLADAVLASGQAFWDAECASLYPNIHRNRVQTSFLVRRPYPRVNGAGRGPDVVYVGRASTVKGMDRVLHAAAAALSDDALRDVLRRFVVIGPSEMVSSSQSERELLSIAQGLPSDRLVFAGRRSEAEIRQFFADAAVAIFPNRVESFCYAAHEAHLAGVPLILSDTPAFRDHFLDGETALFFNNTVGDLVATLRRCLLDAPLRGRLSASVERHRDRYGRHDYAQHLEIPPFRQSASSVAAPGVVLVSVGEASTVTPAEVAALAGSLPSAAIWRLEPVRDDEPGVFAFGRRWKVIDATGRAVAPATQALPPAVVFLAAGTRNASAFLMSAVRILENEPRIAAVFPLGVTVEGRRRTSAAPMLLERCAAIGQDIFGAVQRSAAGGTLADLFEDGSSLTEVAALVRLRAAGGTLVDHPSLGLTRSDNSPVSCSPGLARRRLLRRFAWSVDRVLVADELAEFSELADRVSMATLDEDAQVLAVPGALTIRVPMQVKHNVEPHKASLLAVRRRPGGMLVPSHELYLTGAWREVQLPDRAHPMLIGEGGSLVLPMADDPEVTFLLGPDQSAISLSLEGRAVRLDLRHHEYFQLSLRVRNLFALAEVPGVVEPRFPARSLLQASLHEQICGAVSPGTARIVMLENDDDRPLALAMGVAVGSEVVKALPVAFRDEPSCIGRALSARVDTVAVFGGPGVLPLIEALLGASSSVEVIYTLRPAFSWNTGGWEWLSAAVRLAGRHAGRLRLRASHGAVAGGLRALGAPVDVAHIALPRPVVASPSGAANLLIPISRPSLPSCGHIAAAAAQLYGSGDIATIHLPRAETQTLKILEQFGVAHSVRLHDDTATLLANLAGTRLLYCAPFADGSFDPLTLAVFRAGGLALTAPGPLVHADPALREALEVVAWEDPRHIVEHLRDALRHYDELIMRLAATEAVAT